MDDRKDIQKDDPISRFFDTHVRTNPFGENRFGERVYRRSERIAAAIHLVTNHVSTDEPIRSRVRLTALQLLESTIDARDELRAADSVFLAKIDGTVRLLISEVTMLGVSGFVSLPNTTVIIEALDDLASFMRSAQRSPLSDRFIFTRETFMDKSVRETPRPIKDIADIKGQKDTIVLSDTLKTSVTPSERDMSTRKNVILEILQPGLELGIREIAAHLPEYGEKTIQRELSQLILLGKVKKLGFKRWSKYSRSA